MAANLPSDAELDALASQVDEQLNALQSSRGAALRSGKSLGAGPGGILYEQWHKWRDLQSKSAVKIAYGALAGMGIPTADR